jgi:hypothetical protein
MTNTTDTPADARLLDDDLVLAVARAMKPRLFGPNLDQESLDSPGMYIVRDQVFWMARRAINAVLDHTRATPPVEIESLTNQVHCALPKRHTLEDVVRATTAAIAAASPDDRLRVAREALGDALDMIVDACRDGTYSLTEFEQLKHILATLGEPAQSGETK